MSENSTKTEWVNTEEAAAIANMNRFQFGYWVRNGRGPQSEIIAGNRVFDAAIVRAWKPELHKRGPKPQLQENIDVR